MIYFYMFLNFVEKTIKKLFFKKIGLVKAFLEFFAPPPAGPLSSPQLSF